MNITTRIAIEKRITKFLLKTIESQGFDIRIWDGEEGQNVSAIDALDLAMDLDECSIYAYAIEDGKKAYKASFYLVYGNDGYDVICDHSVNDVTSAILEVVQPLCDELELKHG